MKDLLSLLNLQRLRREMQATSKFVRLEKYFPLRFTHFCKDFSSMLDDSQQMNVTVLCFEKMLTGQIS